MEKEYKLIIADDETIICRGLASFHWKQLGFEMCGAVSDGQECLELMEKVNADVIISDIQMPVLDGLSLARIVHEKFPACKIILLTGHKKFEYAQSPIKSDVTDYLVKPVDLDELDALMRKIHLQLEEEHSKISRLEDIQHKLNESIPWAIEKFLESLVFSAIYDMDETEEKANLLELSFPHPYYACGILRFSELSSPERSSHFLLLLQEYLRKKDGNHIRAYTFCHNTHDFVLILNFNPLSHSQSTYSYLEEFGRQLCTFCRETIGKDVNPCIGIGNIYDHLVSLHVSYEQALNVLDKQFFETDTSLFLAWQERFSFENILLEYPYEQESRLIDAILTGDRANCIKYLADFHDTISRNKKYLNQSQVLNTYQQFLIMLNRRLGVHEISLSDIIGEESPFTNFMHRASNLSLLQAKIEHVLLAAIDKTQAFNNSCNAAAHLAVCQAVEYIHRHYAEKITLSQVADHVHLNASYLSLQFKNETGKNFIEVLKEYRIEKAKELLKNPNYKIYEVSSMIGYQNPNYFTDAFKLLTGDTPLEYRKKFF